MEKVISFLNKEIKEARKSLKKAELGRREFGGFDDCGDFYHSQVDRAEATLGTLIVLRGKIKNL